MHRLTAFVLFIACLSAEAAPAESSRPNLPVSMEDDCMYNDLPLYASRPGTKSRRGRHPYRPGLADRKLHDPK